MDENKKMLNFGKELIKRIKQIQENKLNTQYFFRNEIHNLTTMVEAFVLWSFCFLFLLSLLFIIKCADLSDLSFPPFCDCTLKFRVMVVINQWES